MTPKDQKMEKALSLGAIHFVIYYGILGWGLLTAALVTGIDYFFGRIHTVQISIPNSFLIFPVAGIAWGTAMWVVMKRRAANRQKARVGTLL